MSKYFAATLLVLVAWQSPVSADSWTDGQAEWARHGFKHGDWDCNGDCPDGRRHQARTTLMSLECQQNLDDGRTLISDGRLIPDRARTRIVSYRPTRRESGWSYGTCSVEVTR